MKIVNLYNKGELRASQYDTYPKILNPELYFLETNDSVLAYSPYFNSATKLTAEQYSFLTSNEKLYSSADAANHPNLLNQFFYIDENVYKMLIQANHTEEPKIKVDKIKSLTLIMTSLCNLRCRYCYVFGGEPDKIVRTKKTFGMKNVLDADTALGAIEYFNPSSIKFFGWGEPTLAFDEIKNIVERCSGENFSYTIDTNAVYYQRREQIVKYLVENKVKIQISYDGLPALNDDYRIDYRKNTSTREIMETINEIKKYGDLDEMAHVRVTACGGIEEKMIEVLDHLKNLGFKRVRVEPVLITGRAKEFAFAKPDMYKLAINIAKAAIHAKKIGIAFSSNLLPAAGTIGMACKTCNYILGTAISLGPDYKFYMCVDPLQELCVGEIKKQNAQSYSINLNLDKMAYITSKRNVFKLKDCETCPVKCGGGCTKESYNEYHNLDNSGENKEMCDSKRLALAKYVEYSTNDSLM